MMDVRDGRRRPDDDTAPVVDGSRESSDLEKPVNQLEGLACIPRVTPSASMPWH